MRVKIFHIIIGIFFLIPILGLVFIQIIRGNFYHELSESNYIRLIPQEASRGRIFDRNGIILADNLPSFNLAVLPQEFNNTDKEFSYLSSLLKIDKMQLIKNFKKGYSVPFSPVVIADSISKKETIILEERKASLPGILIQIKPGRFYPYNEICAHILGYLGLIDRSKITRLKDYGYKIKDKIGYSGIEEYYDKYLRGEDGGIQVEVDHKGLQKRILGIRSAKRGKDLALTVDFRFQQAAFESLSGHKGSIIIMDPNTGEILAMVSLPSFNSNIFTLTDFDSKKKQILKGRDSPLLNRAISGLYPPGSIFKIITAIAALEKKKITLQDDFFCRGRLKIGNKEFKCWSEHGIENLRDAIVHSCNVFFYNLGRIIGPELLSRYAMEFNLGRPTGIDLPYESKGIVPNPIKRKLLKRKQWYEGDTANFSIGQGKLLVTPIQMVRVMAAIINGGKLITPRLLKSINNKEIIEVGYTKLSLKKKNLEILKSYFKEVVSDPSGTAHILNLQDIAIAGKTGTAQSGRGRSHAWFLGFCPFDAPQIVFCVVLEHGGSSYNACIVARKFIKRLMDEGLLKINDS